MKRLLWILASLGLAAVWGSAAFLKALDPPAFADQITAHKVMPAGWSLPLAYLFITVEGLLAAAHLAFFRPRLAFPASAALLIVFIGVTGWAWSQGNTEGCGCFGRLAARHPREVILEDVLFLAAALIGYRACHGLAPLRRAALAFGALVPLALALPLVGARLPFDHLITTLNPGEDLSNLAAEDLPGPLEEGSVLLVFLADSCAVCDAAVERLGALAGEPDAPRVIGLFAGTRREARTWTLGVVPGFPVASAPVKVLRQYYRRLPQTALLAGGRIVRVWRDRIPGWEEVRPHLPPRSAVPDRAEPPPP